MDSFVLLALIVAAVGPAAIYAYRRRHWLKAEGRIERCESASIAVGKHRVPGIRLYYSYNIDGDRYGGDFAGTGFSAESAIEDFVQRVGRGTSIVVRYDRMNLGSSILTPEDNPNIELLTGIKLSPAPQDRGPRFLDLDI